MRFCNRVLAAKCLRFNFKWVICYVTVAVNTNLSHSFIRFLFLNESQVSVKRLNKQIVPMKMVRYKNWSKKKAWASISQDHLKKYRRLCLLRSNRSRNKGWLKISAHKSIKKMSVFGFSWAKQEIWSQHLGQHDLFVIIMNKVWCLSCRS